jgi:hypothetical protein
LSKVKFSFELVFLMGTNRDQSSHFPSGSFVMEIAWRRQLEVIERAVGWLTQDNMSHPAHNPSLDVTETADNILNIPCLCEVLLSLHGHSSTRNSGQWFYDTSVMFPDHLSTDSPRLLQT